MGVPAKGGHSKQPIVGQCGRTSGARSVAPLASLVITERLADLIHLCRPLHTIQKRVMLGMEVYVRFLGTTAGLSTGKKDLRSEGPFKIILTSSGTYLMHMCVHREREGMDGSEGG